MLVDIYRDQDLEKILIVKKDKDIKNVSIADSNFLKGLRHHRLINIDDSQLPTGIDKSDVIKRINEQGYYSATHLVTVREVDNPS